MENSNETETVVSLEQATKEVNGYLDFKKFSPRRREERKAAIKELIDAVQDGEFVINSETKEIDYKLKFPHKVDKEFDKLVFQPRSNAGAIQGAMSGVESDDVHGTICAYIAVITNQAKNIIKKLDSEDYNMAKKIAIFFM